MRWVASKPQVLVAHLSHYTPEFEKPGNPPFSTEESPGFHQRAHGNVKSAFRLLAVTNTSLQEAKQLRFDQDGMLASLTVDLRKRTLWLVVAHQSIDSVNLIQRRSRDQGKLFGICAIHNHGVGASHGNAAVFEPVQLLVA